MTETPRPARPAGTPPRALAGEQVRRLAENLVEAAPELLRKAAPEAALERLGWAPRALVGGFGDSSVGAELPLPVNAPALLSVEAGRLSRIYAPITDFALGNLPATRSFRQDAFAAAAATLTDKYGPPFERTPGMLPTMRWQVADQTLWLEDGPAGVGLAIERTEDRERVEWLAAQEAQYDDPSGQP